MTLDEEIASKERLLGALKRMYGRAAEHPAEASRIGIAVKRCREELAALKERSSLRDEPERRP